MHRLPPRGGGWRKQGKLLKYKELVAKISQDAKERKLSTLKQGTEIPDSAQGREREKTGKATEILAEIAGTGKITIVNREISHFPVLGRSLWKQ